MPNPARSKDKIQSSQEYDIGPYKENHRYSVTIMNWAPNALTVEVKLADPGECALAQNYAFTLVDDHGAQSAFQPVGSPTQTTEPGHGNTTLTVSKLSGTFATAVGADTKTITIEQRSPHTNCPELNFRWILE
jgi:hypothetical protein